MYERNWNTTWLKIIFRRHVEILYSLQNFNVKLHKLTVILSMRSNNVKYDQKRKVEFDGKNIIVTTNINVKIIYNKVYFFQTFKALLDQNINLKRISAKGNCYSVIVSAVCFHRSVSPCLAWTLVRSTAFSLNYLWLADEDGDGPVAHGRQLVEQNLNHRGD